MTLNQLNYVIAIAEYGSMNKAAEHLYVAQPSLSGAVKSLEDELGFALFNRNGRCRLRRTVPIFCRMHGKYTHLTRT